MQDGIIYVHPVYGTWGETHYARHPHDLPAPLHLPRRALGWHEKRRGLRAASFVGQESRVGAPAFFGWDPHFASCGGRSFSTETFSRWANTGRPVSWGTAVSPWMSGVA